MNQQNNEASWSTLDQIFATCTPISSAFDVNNLYQHYSNGYQYMAMTDYPYPASFLEPMPAWPVKEAVKPFVDIPEKAEATAEDFIKKSESGLSVREERLFNALAESTNVYFNYTGQYPCTNLSDWEGTGDLDGYGWNILACNQLAMPIGFNSDSMFIPAPFDYAGYTEMC